MIWHIDLWLLSRCERASHAIQRWTGVDCFWQSRICFVGWMIGMGNILVRFGREQGHLQWEDWAIFGFLVIAIKQELKRQRPEPGVRTVAQIMEAPLRVTLVGMSVAWLSGLVAGTPLPPAPILQPAFEGA